MRGRHHARAGSGAYGGVPRGVRSAVGAPGRRRVGAGSEPRGIGTLRRAGLRVRGSVRAFRASSTSRAETPASVRSEPRSSRARAAPLALVRPTPRLMLRVLLLRRPRRERTEAHKPAAALDALLQGLDATLLRGRRAIAFFRHGIRWALRRSRWRVPEPRGRRVDLGKSCALVRPPCAFLQAKVGRALSLFLFRIKVVPHKMQTAILCESSHEMTKASESSG